MAFFILTLDVVCHLFLEPELEGSLTILFLMPRVGSTLSSPVPSVQMAIKALYE